VLKTRVLLQLSGDIYYNKVLTKYSRFSLLDDGFLG